MLVVLRIITLAHPFMGSLIRSQEPGDNPQEDFNNENHPGDENEDNVQEEEEEETPYQLPLELSAH